MNFLHYDFHLDANDTVEVTLDRQANARLLDDVNFSRYKRGQRHTCYGGLVKISPAHIRPPHPVHWHLVIDLGGYSGTVRASVRVVQV
jgi:hypothetical protein